MFNRRQQGSALTVAIFVIVVMTLLGTAMIQLFAGSSQSVISDVSGQRAYFAANSGLEQYLTELFPLRPNVGGVDVCDTASESSPRSYAFNAMSGLTNCSAQVICSAIPLDNAETHFQVISTGTCQVGEETFSREVLVESSEVND